MRIEYDKLRMKFIKTLKNNILMSEWAQVEVLKSFDEAVESMETGCPLCGDGCNCKGGA